MEETAQHLMSPWMQFGFAGTTFLLIGVIVWMFKQQLVIMNKMTDKLVENTEAYHELKQSVDVLTELGGNGMNLLREQNDKLLSRPCLIDK